MAKVEFLTAERAPLLARPYYEGGDPGPNADRAWAYAGVATI